MSTTRGGRKRPQYNAPDANSSRRRTAERAAARAAGPDRDVHVAEGIRLQKVMAAAGVGSRRACEEMIAQGRVEVDGVRVTELGLRVDPKKNAIYVDGMRVQADDAKITIALNKPEGVLTTMADPEDRPTVAEYVYNRGERLFHVGRLDVDSEGLLLFTNDGELSHRLSHPKYHVTKTYMVEVEGRVPGNLGTTLLNGIELEDGPVHLDYYRVVDHTAKSSLIEVRLHEGRNRIVRRIFEHVGFPVVRLVRTQIGPIKLGNLRVGSTRVLGQTELGTLMDLVGL